MAALNLTPNAPVILVQAGIFLANLVIVKKLMLDPYVQLRAKRDAATTGSQDEAKSLLAKSEQLRSTIHEKMVAARSQASEQYVETLAVAEEKRSKVLSEAEKEAKESLNTMRQQIEAQVKAAQSQLPQLVDNLSKDVYAKAIQ